MTMSGFDLIKMALRNLWKRKLRTFLTVLGVIIGTASIVVMISVGIGMNEGYKNQIEKMGSLYVINLNVPYSYDDSNNKNKDKAKLDTATLEELRQIEGVEAVTPMLQEYFILIDGRNIFDTSIIGILPETMELMGFKVSTGRTLQEGDSMAVVLSSYAREEFYNPKLSWQYRWNGSQNIEIDPYGDKFQLTYDYSYGTKSMDKSIKPKKIEIVGEMDQNGQNSYATFMPLGDVEKIVAEREKHQKAAGQTNNGNKKKKGVYDQAMVKVRDMKDVERIQQEIKDMGFEASSLEDYLKQAQETSTMLQMVLGAIGAISLFVAAIGIANTMVMSIYERTREIGVMKVIGATIPDIRRLFLTEAAFIGLLGGMVGVILSYASSKIINMVSMNMGRETISLIPIWLGLLGIVFATFVGVAAGFFPAVRATKLSALAAIKTE